MQDFWIDLGFSVTITALKAAVKDPKKKEQMRAVFRKIFNLILQAYPEFE